MKVRVSRNDIKRVGLNRTVVFAELALRAKHASLLEGDKPFFYSPIARCEGEFSEDLSYRPLTDVLSFLGEQTIRDCIIDLENEESVEVFRNGNRWDHVVLPSGKVQKKRTHRYHIPAAILSRHQEEVRTKNSYLVFDTEMAVKYGLTEAIILNQFEYGSAKQRKKCITSDIVVMTVKTLAEKICSTENTVRRALRRLVDMGALERIGGSSYKLVHVVTIRLNDTFEVRSLKSGLVRTTVVPEMDRSDGLLNWSLPIPAQFVPTGISELDRNIDSFGKGELAFLVGQTGHGKTITMLNFAVGAALAGYKPLIFSLEMSAADLQARLLSNVSQLDCEKIRTGRISGQSCLDGLAAQQAFLLRNIRIVELRGRVTAADLADQVQGLKAEGYCPDEVLIDQFSYLTPNRKLSDDANDWKNQKNVAGDLADWAETSLASETPFSIWCLHQANGDPALEFGRDSISGCKAVVEPASLVVGIGHRDQEPRKLRMFSLKTRHGQPFEFALPCDFSRMKIGAPVVVEGQLVLAS